MRVPPLSYGPLAPWVPWMHSADHQSQWDALMRAMPQPESTEFLSVDDAALDDVELSAPKIAKR